MKPRYPPKEAWEAWKKYKLRCLNREEEPLPWGIFDEGFREGLRYARSKL